MSDDGADIPVSGDLLLLPLRSDGTAEAASLERALLKRLSDAGWAQAGTAITDHLLSVLGLGDRFAKGWTLYDIHLSLDGVGEPMVRRTPSGDIGVHLVAEHNTITATTTTPYVNGSELDPRFSVDFALELDYTIDLPPVAGPIGTTGLQLVAVRAIHPDSQNLVADILELGVGIYEWLTGDDLLGALCAAIERRYDLVEINAALAALNGTVERLAGLGYTYLEARAGSPADLLRQLGRAAGSARELLGGLASGDQYLMLVCRAPDRSGAIEGSIGWPDHLGRPVPKGRALPVWRWTDAATAATASRPSLTMISGGTPGPALPAGASPAATPSPAAASPAAPAPAPPTALSIFHTMVADPTVYMSLMDDFHHGPQEFVVRAAGPGSIGRLPRMAWQWADQGASVNHRSFRLEGVETDTALQVSCELSPEWVWDPPADVTFVPDGWTGTVTVRHNQELVDSPPDHSDRIAVSVQEAAAARQGPADGRLGRAFSIDPAASVELNPQPIPPGHDRRPAAQIIADSIAAAQQAEHGVVRDGVASGTTHRLLAEAMNGDRSGVGVARGVDFASEAPAIFGDLQRERTHPPGRWAPPVS